jgi:hypothetical protein
MLEREVEIAVETYAASLEADAREDGLRRQHVRERREQRFGFVESIILAKEIS